MIYVIDDDEVMAGCVARACKGAVRTGEVAEVQIFGDGITAMAAMDDVGVPDLVFLDILLDGPDGFTLLNEMASYADTARVPIVVVSSLDFAGKDLSMYGVVGVLNKDTMVPQEIRDYVAKYVG